MPKARSSAWLTEARTVHSRAITALNRLDYLDSGRNAEYHGPVDPLSKDIREALEQVVSIMDKFSKESMKGTS